MLVIYDCYQIGIGEKIHVVALATQILVGRCSVCRSRCFERLACYTLDIASKLLGILEGFGFHRLALFLRFTNRSSSRFQRRKPSICVSSSAPCMLVKIARIFALPREPTTRIVSPGLRF